MSDEAKTEAAPKPEWTPGKAWVVSRDDVRGLLAYRHESGASINIDADAAAKMTKEQKAILARELNVAVAAGLHCALTAHGWRAATGEWRCLVERAQ